MAKEINFHVMCRSVLEYQRGDLDQPCKGVEGALAEREKSLREEELSCANIRKRRESLVAHFMEQRQGDNPTDTEVQWVGETSMEEDAELRIIDKDLEFGLHILNRESARIEELRKEQEGLESELRKIKSEIRLRGVAQTRGEQWAAKLTDQVQLMAVGSGMGTTPLPIRNPRQPLQGRMKTIYISNCPVCGYNFKCHNITVADCSCCYHHFCLAAWLSDGKRRCASETCVGFEFGTDWIESFGANQVMIPLLRQPKEEGMGGRFNSLTVGNVAAAASTNCESLILSCSSHVECASGTSDPVHALHMFMLFNSVQWIL